MDQKLYIVIGIDGAFTDPMPINEATAEAHYPGDRIEEFEGFSPDYSYTAHSGRDDEGMI